LRQDDSLTVFLKEQNNASVPTLEYEYNDIKFEYGAFTGQLNQKVEFKTMLMGHEKLATAWTKESSYNYTNLWEGTYTFMVKARDKYGNESEWTSYRFRIKPPMARSLPALLVYFVLFMALLKTSVSLNARRLTKANQKLESIVRIRTAEIDAQKTEIEKQRFQLKKSNLELEKLSIVARETDNAIVIMDTDGNIEWVNEGFVKRYGYSLEECIASENKNIVHYSQNPLVLETIGNCVKNKKSYSYELLSRTKSGEKVWAHTTLTPIVNAKNSVSKIIAIDSDISRLKEAQSEIYQQKEEIESQRNMLSDLNATKDKLFSIIAHDLRGPLGTVINSTGMIVDNYELFDDVERKSLLFEIHKASFATYNLLENLLHWSRSQRGELRFKPEKVDLSLLVNEVIELLSVSTKKKEITISNFVEDGYFAYADENMLSSVLRNLLSNALKFTESKGSIEVKIEENNNFYIVSVKDTGIGMSLSAQQNLFQLDSFGSTPGTANEKGIGLGLMLANEFIQLNRGKIWLESELGKGSIFYFTIIKWNE
jgi:PAS domain S-box-containing protein